MLFVTSIGKMKFQHTICAALWRPIQTIFSLVSINEIYDIQNYSHGAYGVLSMKISTFNVLFVNNVITLCRFSSSTFLGEFVFKILVITLLVFAIAIIIIDFIFFRYQPWFDYYYYFYTKLPLCSFTTAV